MSCVDATVFSRMRRSIRTMALAEVPDDLPDPLTMSIEDLRAEVEGGRIAYATLVHDLTQARERIIALERAAAWGR
jgi:hypothetical protein